MQKRQLIGSWIKQGCCNKNHKDNESSASGDNGKHNVTGETCTPLLLKRKTKQRMPIVGRFYGGSCQGIRSPVGSAGEEAEDRSSFPQCCIEGYNEESFVLVTEEESSSAGEDHILDMNEDEDEKRGSTSEAKDESPDMEKWTTGIALNFFAPNVSESVQDVQNITVLAQVVLGFVFI